MDFGMHSGRRDLDRMGLFAEMGYMNGEKYKTPVNFPKIRDEKGSQMFPGYPKWKTDLQDCYFDTEFKRIFVKEALTDMPKRERRERMEAKKKNITSAGFIPTGPSKKQAGSGDYFGTFGGIVPEFSPVLKKVEGKKKEPYVGNMLSNPGKKGGPGYIDITINPYPAYKSTKYDDPKTPGKKPPSVTPFITGNSKPYFNENPYLAEKVMPVYRKEVEQKYTAYGTFMPNSKMKTMDGCFSARPEYIHEKYIPKNKVDKEFERILKEKAAKFQAISGKKYTTLVNPPFVPNPGIRSTFTGSIVTKNVDMLPFTPGRYKTLEPVTYTDRYLQ